MTPTLKILVGDALEQLRSLPDESAQCCVTSRSAVLIELNPEYARLIEQRCAITPGLAL